MKVIIDANMFLVPGKYKVDIFQELRSLGKTKFYTLDSVVKELKKIAEGRGKDARNAKLGLQLLDKNKIKVLKSEGNTDDALLNSGMPVCTQDKKLMIRLKKKGVEIIYLRQKKYLDNR